MTDELDEIGEMRKQAIEEIDNVIEAKIKDILRQKYDGRIITKLLLKQISKDLASVRIEATPDELYRGEFRIPMGDEKDE